MLYNEKREYRCKRCHKLLAKIVVKEYAGMSHEIEIKCPRCEYLNLTTVLDVVDSKK
jgi:phage FluMu protein Com